MTERLYVTWDKRPVGTLDRTGGTYGYDYTFTYDRTADRAVSVALPIREAPYPNAQTRPFFDALLPEGALRESLAAQFRLPLNDAFGLLDKLGRDCAGALQIVAAVRPSDTRGVDWLDAESLAAEIRELPSRPLGMPPGTRTRLSLAGVQRKAVLVRGADGRFGLPVHGAPTTHLVKPEPVDGEPAGIAVNEFFCMRLAAAVGLPVAGVELMTVADQRCLVVERFDRDLTAHPVRRLHQEDLCQAMGISPALKYAAPDRLMPTFGHVARVLDEHGSRPGVDRLTAGRMAVLNFLIGNADAHGKNMSFLHEDDGRIRLAPLYDLVSTAAWPHLDRHLAMPIADELDPDRITYIAFDDLAIDLGLAQHAFARDREGLVVRLRAAAADLIGRARQDGWHHPILDTVVDVIEARTGQVLQPDAAVWCHSTAL